jgi:N-methylhydantoinase A
MSWLVGIDTGGTFTDLAAAELETDQRYVTKVPSTPGKPSDAIVAALQTFQRDCDVPFSEIRFFGHGTTVGTNAVLEGKGAQTGLVVTAGYNAIYEVRGGTRPSRVELVDPRYQKPRPLIPLHLTRYVDERVAFDGSVVRPLDEESVRRAARELRDQGVSSVAVLCLFSFMNPSHEERIAEIIREEHPECRVSLSSRVLPVIREYMRLSTTALDAYVGPVIQRYFADLADRLQEEGLTTGQSYAMQSNGGLMRISLAAAYPNETLLSGPAAGVGFGLRLGERTGEANVVTLDMGGTSTDVCVIRDGKASETREGQIARQHIGTPMIEINTLGTGGGTLAWIGKDGLLKVGPQSAGAEPGPACYGRGGTEPTVTDADVVLGYLDPTKFLGGRMHGVPELAEQAVARVGAELGLSAVEAAEGIHRIAYTQIAIGLRLTLEAKGCDVTSFALVPFGGAGPVLAWRVADAVGIPRLLVPPSPGIGSAMGLLETDVLHVYMKSYMARTDRADLATLNRGFAELTDRARLDADAEGFDWDEVQLHPQLDLRYPHQGYELAMDLPATTLDEGDLARLRSDFDVLHEAVYGVSAPDEPVEIINLRLRSRVERPRLNLAANLPGSSTPEPRRRPAYFEMLGGYVDTPVYDRAAMPAGTELEGPAIVEQLDATTVIGPGWRGSVDRDGNVRLSNDRSDS